MNYKQQILEKINTNAEVVGIIGLGYVGLPLAVNFAEAGIKVIGFDKSEVKVTKINSGENYIKDIRDAVLREVVDRVKLEATTDFTRMKECDALIICVPTPLDKFRKPDMSYIEAACVAIGQNMKPGTFISLESTTYPTTTEDYMLPIIVENINHNPNFENVVTLSEVEGTSSNLPPMGGQRGAFWLAYSPEHNLSHKKHTQGNWRHEPKRA
ncbi:MAG: nucleotide sugar [Prolixibacteraceae bacterium]|nr:MAG: nucleotide sugar [Prolixibacteraceae bacterium]